MTTAKLTNDLSDKIHGLPESETTLRVIVELNAGKSAPIGAGTSRQEKIRLQKQDFQAGLDAVAEVISRGGGKLLDSAWINRSVLVEVPVSALDGITDLAQVASVDTPRVMTSD